MLRSKAASEASAPIWRVVQSGEEELGNAHGLKRDSIVARSVAPLKTMHGVAFAALVCGPPAVPDELMQMAARSAYTHIYMFICMLCAVPDELMQMAARSGRPPTSLLPTASSLLPTCLLPTSYLPPASSPLPP